MKSPVHVTHRAGAETVLQSKGGFLVLSLSLPIPSANFVREPGIEIPVLHALIERGSIAFSAVFSRKHVALALPTVFPRAAGSWHVGLLRGLGFWRWKERFRPVPYLVGR